MLDTTQFAVLSPGPSLEEIEARQDEILQALDALNARILRVLEEHGITVPPLSLPGDAKAA